MILLSLSDAEDGLGDGRILSTGNRTQKRPERERGRSVQRPSSHSDLDAEPSGIVAGQDFHSNIRMSPGVHRHRIARTNASNSPFRYVLASFPKRGSCPFFHAGQEACS